MAPSQRHPPPCRHHRQEGDSTGPTAPGGPGRPVSQLPVAARRGCPERSVCPAPRRFRSPARVWRQPRRPRVAATPAATPTAGQPGDPAVGHTGQPHRIVHRQERGRADVEPHAGRARSDQREWWPSTRRAVYRACPSRLPLITTPLVGAVSGDPWCTQQAAASARSGSSKGVEGRAPAGPDRTNMSTPASTVPWRLLESTTQTAGARPRKRCRRLALILPPPPAAEGSPWVCLGEQRHHDGVSHPLRASTDLSTAQQRPSRC
jgi:hypothetical protein